MTLAFISEIKNTKLLVLNDGSSISVLPRILKSSVNSLEPDSAIWLWRGEKDNGNRLIRPGGGGDFDQGPVICQRGQTTSLRRRRRIRSVPIPKTDDGGTCFFPRFHSSFHSSGTLFWTCQHSCGFPRLFHFWCNIERISTFFYPRERWKLWAAKRRSECRSSSYLIDS